MIWLLPVVLLVVLVGWPIKRWFDRQAAERYRAACKAAIEVKDWQTLERESSAWLRYDPEADDALIFLAEAAVQQDDAERAVDCLGRVNDQYQGALAALSVRAEIQLADLAKPWDAEASWERMLRINPLATVAHQRLIYLYAMTLQKDKLLAAIKRAIEVGSEPPEAYSYLLLSNSLNFSDGLKKTTRWLRKNPGDPVLEVAQALFAAKQSLDNELATSGEASVIPGDRGLLLKCLEKYPRNRELIAFELDYAIFNGDEDRVVELLSLGAENAEQDARFWGARGWLLERRNQLPEAVEALSWAVELDPFRWQSRWLLADVYRKLGQAEQARVQSEISLLGKELQFQLLERPTARDITPELVERISDYLQRLQQKQVWQALNRRR